MFPLERTGLVLDALLTRSIARSAQLCLLSNQVARSKSCNMFYHVFWGWVHLIGSPLLQNASSLDVDNFCFFCLLILISTPTLFLRRLLTWKTSNFYPSDTFTLIKILVLIIVEFNCPVTKTVARIYLPSSINILFTCSFLMLHNTYVMHSSIVFIFYTRIFLHPYTVLSFLRLVLRPNIHNTTTDEIFQQNRVWRK